VKNLEEIFYEFETDDGNKETENQYESWASLQLVIVISSNELCNE